ncbi:Site-specific DNA-cytosine methylase (plasmid) [Nostoc flagelliforme CCNUN1]|uniref:Site-specific DNA-cytosine methylase n=1 Tax=Nostoc flagelliforme CCNUN1 TaxID=2038116 RepID=A0A2K8T6I7_9NOSO|nr:Site-specific DNA-cytosine methylase [Nostoc flagelliforme CCNUN1]
MKTRPNPVSEDISLQENPASVTIEVTAVEIPELTEQEISDRLHLERRVERAFFEAGKALMELRDRRLYRSTHKTFEEYCRDRFSYTYRHVNYLIAASLIVENIIISRPKSFPEALPVLDFRLGIPGAEISL